jgi:hypothetical protein
MTKQQKHIQNLSFAALNHASNFTGEHLASSCTQEYIYFSSLRMNVHNQRTAVARLTQATQRHTCYGNVRRPLCSPLLDYWLEANVFPKRPATGKS